VKHNKLLPPAEDVGRHIVAHESSETPYNQLYPVFSLEHMARWVKDHCLLTCNKDERAAFAMALNKLSQLTWAQLKQAPREKLGYEKISSLKVVAPGGIPKGVSFVAFRFEGMKPMIGYREKNIFHVVWLDHKFKCYKHS
jgi:hypothetical protein